MTVLLELNGVSKFFGALKAVDSVSVKFVYLLLRSRHGRGE
jgi:ABC-type branched-subunit amino acid transport system ATPase component